MGTEILTIDGTHSLGLWQVLEEPQRQVDKIADTSFPSDRPAAALVLDEFVRLLRDNSKVWAVYGTEDPSGIRIWTYIDSTDRNDRSLVYEAEWQLLKLFPEVGFDFNTAMVPAGHEQFDDRKKVYLYRR
jgi:hypothetical protein